jgi:G protein beta subunit-like protein
VPAPDTPVRSISISADGSFVCVGSHKGRLFVYNYCHYLLRYRGGGGDRGGNTGGGGNSAGLEHSLDFQAHDDFLLKCVISPDMATIATTSADKTIRLWSTAPPHNASGGEDPAPPFPLLPPSFASSSSLNSTTSSAELVLSEDTADTPLPPAPSLSPAPLLSSPRAQSREPLQLVGTLSQHQRWVWDCVFSLDSQFLLSASSDQSVKLWNLAAGGEVVRNYIGHSFTVSCVALNDLPLSGNNHSASSPSSL